MSDKAAVKTEFLVLGLGAVGAAVALQLQRRGRPFIGLERGRPPHALGSSHGDSRITRHATGEGEAYVALVRRSDEIWRSLEDVAPRRLRTPSGVLYLTSGPDGAVRNGAENFLAETEAVARAAGIDLQPLSAADLHARFPQFQVGAEARALFEPGAGVLNPEACVEALLGAVAPERLRLGETILHLRPAGAGVEVETDRAVYRADHAIVAMGAWTPDFVGGAFREDFAVLRQVQFWFRTEDPAPWQAAASPPFIWFHGADVGDQFYGFPLSEGGRPGVKVAAEQHEIETDPGAPVAHVTDAEIAQMYRQHVQGRLRGVTADCLATAACFYTYNRARDSRGRDGRFRIGPHPEAPAATVVSACSGHGFKHSAGLGAELVDRLLAPQPSHTLDPFWAPS